MSVIENRPLRRNEFDGVSCFPVKREIIDTFTSKFEKKEVREKKFWEIKDKMKLLDPEFYRLYVKTELYSDFLKSGFIPGVIFGYGVLSSQIESRQGEMPHILPVIVGLRREEIGFDIERVIRSGGEFDIDEIFKAYEARLFHREQELQRGAQIMSEQAYGIHFIKGIVEISRLTEMSL